MFWSASLIIITFSTISTWSAVLEPLFLVKNKILHLLTQSVFPSGVSETGLRQAPHCSLHSSSLSQKQPCRWRRNFTLSGWPVVSLMTHIYPLHRQQDLSCCVPSSSVSSLGPRLSNRDCACLRLSQGFKVGSYPSSAIQPSILAWYRGPNGQVLQAERLRLAVNSVSSKYWWGNCGVFAAH